MAGGFSKPRDKVQVTQKARLEGRREERQLEEALALIAKLEQQVVEAKKDKGEGEGKGNKGELKVLEKELKEERRKIVRLEELLAAQTILQGRLESELVIVQGKLDERSAEEMALLRSEQQAKLVELVDLAERQQIELKFSAEKVTTELERRLKTERQAEDNKSLAASKVAVRTQVNTANLSRDQLVDELVRAEEALRTRDQDNRTLTRRFDVLTVNLAAQKQEYKELKAAGNHAAQAFKDADIANEKSTEHLGADLRRCLKESAGIKTQLASLTFSLDDMTARHSNANRNLQLKTKELATLQASQATHDGQLNALRKQVSKSDSKVVRLERELAAASSKKPDHPKSTIASLEAALQAERALHVEAVQELAAKTSDHIADYKHLDSRKVHLQEQLATSNTNLVAAQNEIANLKERVASLGPQLSTRQKNAPIAPLEEIQVTQLEKDLAAAVTKLAEFEANAKKAARDASRFERFKETNTTLRNDNAALRTENSSLSRTLARKNDLTLAQTSAPDQIAMVSAELEALRCQAARSDAKVIELERTLEAFTTTPEGSEQHVASLEASLEAAQTALLRKGEEVEDKSTQLASQLALIASLRQQVSSAASGTSASPVDRPLEPSRLDDDPVAKDPELQALAVQLRNALAICAESEAINVSNAAFNDGAKKSIMEASTELQRRTDDVNVILDHIGSLGPSILDIDERQLTFIRTKTSDRISSLESALATSFAQFAPEIVDKDRKIVGLSAETPPATPVQETSSLKWRREELKEVKEELGRKTEELERSEKMVRGLERMLGEVAREKGAMVLKGAGAVVQDPEQYTARIASLERSLEETRSLHVEAVQELAAKEDDYLDQLKRKTSTSSQLESQLATASTNLLASKQQNEVLEERITSLGLQLSAFKAAPLAPTAEARISQLEQEQAALVALNPPAAVTKSRSAASEAHLTHLERQLAQSSKKLEQAKSEITSLKSTNKTLFSSTSTLTRELTLTTDQLARTTTRITSADSELSKSAERRSSLLSKNSLLEDRIAGLDCELALLRSANPAAVVVASEATTPSGRDAELEALKAALEKAEWQTMSQTQMLEGEREQYQVLREAYTALVVDAPPPPLRSPFPPRPLPTPPPSDVSTSSVFIEHSDFVFKQLASTIKELHDVNSALRASNSLLLLRLVGVET